MPQGCSTFCNRQVNFFILILITPNFYGFLYYRSGGRPWYKSDPNYDPIWDYVAEYHYTDEYDEVFAVAGPEEWCKIMDAYNFFCFRISGFEIVRTPEMGLGSYLTYLLYVCCLLTIYLLVLSAIFLCIINY